MNQSSFARWLCHRYRFTLLSTGRLKVAPGQLCFVSGECRRSGVIGFFHLSAVAIGRKVKEWQVMLHLLPPTSLVWCFGQSSLLSDCLCGMSRPFSLLSDSVCRRYLILRRRCQTVLEISHSSSSLSNSLRGRYITDVVSLYCLWVY